MADLGDVMLALGRVQEGVDRLRNDLAEEKEQARENRAIIHRRLDEQSGIIAHLETTVAISGQVDAQIRNEIAGLKDTIEKIQPHIEDMKRLKTLGWGISGLIALAGLTIGSIVAYASDAVRAIVKHWLG